MWIPTASESALLLTSCSFNCFDFATFNLIFKGLMCLLELQHLFVYWSGLFVAIGATNNWTYFCGPFTPLPNKIQKPSSGSKKKVMGNWTIREIFSKHVGSAMSYLNLWVILLVNRPTYIQYSTGKLSFIRL